jgi:hypothetical protein
MVRLVADRVPGQHIGLQTGNVQRFYLAIGSRPQPELMSLIVGERLDNDESRSHP